MHTHWKRPGERRRMPSAICRWRSGACCRRQKRAGRRCCTLRRVTTRFTCAPRVNARFVCADCGDKRQAAKDKSGGASRRKRAKTGELTKVATSPCGHEEKCFKMEVNKSYSPQWRMERNMGVKDYPMTCYACGDGL